ncbi:MAG TPA: hydrogenase maturation nickel metallochaperone HypA [Gemmataceae bacterium]|nr:hydrogenase maturation nickel metallochaperone HypA [Gemmataceae bacterium]
MHELSIALSILDIAAEEAKRLGGSVAAIHLRLGPLSGVAPAALRSAYGLAREMSALPKAELVIDEVPLVGYCATCTAERSPPSELELFCPVCSTPMPQILGGRELEVVALELEA